MQRFVSPLLCPCRSSLNWPVVNNKKTGNDYFTFPLDLDIVCYSNNCPPWLLHIVLQEHHHTHTHFTLLFDSLHNCLGFFFSLTLFCSRRDLVFRGTRSKTPLQSGTMWLGQPCKITFPGRNEEKWFHFHRRIQWLFLPQTNSAIRRKSPREKFHQRLDDNVEMASGLQIE